MGLGLYYCTHPLLLCLRWQGLHQGLLLLQLLLLLMVVLGVHQ
jgi:hypothetical protein